MIRLALEKFSAPAFADKFSVARRDLATNGDEMWVAFDFESFEGVVIKIHLVRFSGNFAAVIRIVDDQVSVAPGLDRSFAWEESEDFRRLRAGGIDEPMDIDPATFDAVGEIEIDPVLKRRNAVWDSRKVMAAHDFLRRKIEGRVIGREG